jgi:hypothetical protein
VRLTGIKIDDVIEADVRGQRFYAAVEQVEPHHLWLRGLNGKALGYERVSARQVVGHYRRAAGSR